MLLSQIKLPPFDFSDFQITVDFCPCVVTYRAGDGLRLYANIGRFFTDKTNFYLQLFIH